MDEAFCYWADNSVGDIMYMLMQALEVSKTLWDPNLQLDVIFSKLQALSFIHKLNIAHRVSSAMYVCSM
jgi:hypothetical protein